MNALSDIVGPLLRGLTEPITAWYVSASARAVGWVFAVVTVASAATILFVPRNAIWGTAILGAVMSMLAGILWGLKVWEVQTANRTRPKR